MAPPPFATPSGSLALSRSPRREASGQEPQRRGGPPLYEQDAASGYIPEGGRGEYRTCDSSGVSASCRLLRRFLRLAGFRDEPSNYRVQSSSNGRDGDGERELQGDLRSRHGSKDRNVTRRRKAAAHRVVVEVDPTNDCAYDSARSPILQDPLEGHRLRARWIRPCSTQRQWAVEALRGSTPGQSLSLARSRYERPRCAIPLEVGRQLREAAGLSDERRPHRSGRRALRSSVETLSRAGWTGARRSSPDRRSGRADLS